MVTKNQVWRLARRPRGALKDNQLSWCLESVPQLGDGDVLTRVIYLSVDPSSRIWMSDMDQYMEPVAVGDVMRGMALGVVEDSRHKQFVRGDLVVGMLGWQIYAVTKGEGLNKIPRDNSIPLSAYLGPLGFIGATAYFGMLEVGEVQKGDTVVVSAAAGAVGSLAGQIAKIHGARVIGITGSDEKCDLLTEEYGFDGAINYRDDNVSLALAEFCPVGIDVIFENVGGDILDASLEHINVGARIALCGLISMYNEKKPVPGPFHFPNILMKRARLQGFLILDYIERYGEATAQMKKWIKQGKIKYQMDVVQGLDNAFVALKRLFQGANRGKQLVQVSPLP